MSILRRFPGKTLFLTLGLLPALVGAEESWLHQGKAEPKLNFSSASSKDTPLPRITVRADNAKLGTLAAQIMKVVRPETQIKLGQDGNRRVSLDLVEATPEEALEVLRIASGLHLVIQKKPVLQQEELVSMGPFEAPYPSPPTAGSLELLSKKIGFRAQEQTLYKSLRVIARNLKLQVAVPTESTAKKVTLSSKGNVATIFEQLGKQARVTIWLEGRLLRVREGLACPLPSTPMTAEALAAQGKVVTLRAKDQPLQTVVNLLSLNAGLKPAVSRAAGQITVSADYKQMTMGNICEELEKRYPVRVRIDSKFMTVELADPRATVCRPDRTGSEWQPLAQLVYQNPAPSPTPVPLFEENLEEEGTFGSP